jgi:hypothetical protein
LKDIFVLSLFCDKKHINPKMLPLWSIFFCVKNFVFLKKIHIK